MKALETKEEAIKRLEAMGYLDPNCTGCKPAYEAKMPWDVFAPSHLAKPSCKSGKHNHCSCDTCF